MAVDKIKYYLIVYLSFIKKNLTVETSFTFDFVFGFVIGLMQQGISLIFITVIFGNVPTLQAWGFNECLMLFGFSMIPNGICEFFFNNIWQISGKYVISAGFDRLLTRPLPVMFSVIADSNSFHALITTVEGLIICVIAGIRMELSVNLLTVIMIMFLSICGALIIRYTHTIFMSMSFWISDAMSLMVLVSFSKDFMRYPLTIYHKGVQYFFTFILPFAFTSFFPAAFLLGFKEYYIYALFVPVVTVILGVLSSLFFKYGLKHYSSGGG